MMSALDATVLNSTADAYPMTADKPAEPTGLLPGATGAAGVCARGA